MKNLILTAALTTACLLAPTLATSHGGNGTITVISVQPDSPAAAAGLEADDRILRLDGQEISTQEDLAKIMSAHQPGDTVPLVVEREGENVELNLTFGERPGGGVSIGVSLGIGAGHGAGAAGSGEGLTRDECLAWVDETYRVDAMVEELGLGLQEDAATVRACQAGDVQRMPSPMPTWYCDNSFKIHCSGLGLLTEIGEALVERCGELLGEPLSSCAADKVFDGYATSGEASDEAACRASQLACVESS